MDLSLLIAVIMVMPLLGSIANGFFLRSANVGAVAVVATTAILIPFLSSLILFFYHFLNNSDPIHLYLFDWIGLNLSDTTEFKIPFSSTVDRLSIILLLIIPGIGSLIHIYAAGYMHHEKYVHRFFCYLNLSVFSMLNLVLGSNMLVTFLGWEGVGVCSYLLIGYWYSQEENAAAGMKAFIANRVGDLGFLLAMFFSIRLFGTLDYAPLASKVASLPPSFFTDNSFYISLMGLALLLGVTGKSAQIPLYIWLPDAMAGPTPVSALIHAATMVTSGIYLMTRLSFLLVHSEIVMVSIAFVGGATALFAATIGIVQNDIKKVLAYSTVSQLGFMVMGCGVGAFQYGVAHLVTHAFFKALLFLGAGSVIHALHHEQDLRKMGGLIKQMPITGTTFIIGTLAIIGFPGLSGFFSKDEILYYAWVGPFGSPILWFLGAAAAACTSFYMVRLTWLTFLGPSRVDTHAAHHLHENPFVMTIPLVILAFFAVVGGYISIPHGIAHLFGYEGKNIISKWLTPILQQASTVMETRAHEHPAFLEWTLMGTSTLVMVLMSGFALLMYKNGPQGGKKLSEVFSPLYNLLLNKWKIDEVYQVVFVNPLKKLGALFYEKGDRIFIEGVVTEGPKSLQMMSYVVSDLHSGMIRSYLRWFFIGLVFFTWWVLNHG